MDKNEIDDAAAKLNKLKGGWKRPPYVGFPDLRINAVIEGGFTTSTQGIKSETEWEKVTWR